MKIDGRPRKIAGEQDLSAKPATGSPFVDYLRKLSATNEGLIKEVGMHETQKK